MASLIGHTPGPDHWSTLYGGATNVAREDYERTCPQGMSCDQSGISKHFKAPIATREVPLWRVLILKRKQGWLHGFGLFEHAMIWAAEAGAGLWKVRVKQMRKTAVSQMESFPCLSTVRA